MSTNIQMWPHTESQPETSKRRKKRNKPTLHITLEKATYDWLKENVGNISQFINDLVKSFKNQIEPHIIVLTPKEAERRWCSLVTPGLAEPLPRVQIPAGARLLSQKSYLP